MIKKLDASHWRGRLVGSLLFAFFLWAIGMLPDVVFSGDAWGYASRENVLTAGIAGLIWFIIFTIWPNAGRPGREPGE